MTTETRTLDPTAAKAVKVSERIRRADLWVSADDCAGLERACAAICCARLRLIGAGKACFPAAHRSP